MMKLEYIGNGERYNYPINGKVAIGDVIRVDDKTGQILLNSPEKWKVKGSRKKTFKKKVEEEKIELEEVTSEIIEDDSIQWWTG